MTKILFSILLLPLTAVATPKPPTAENRSAILTQARMVPDLMNGHVVGYRVLQIQPGSAWDKMGIKDNDVILRADGEAIDNAATAFEKLGRIGHATSGRSTLVLRRNGEEITKIYEGQSQVKR